jgi:hypothetical protein
VFHEADILDGMCRFTSPCCICVFNTSWIRQREFSRVLQVAPNLESFTLTKVHKSNEEDMTRSAGRIAVENPNLRNFTLRTTPDSWFSAARGRVRQLGVYELLEWNHGIGCQGAERATSTTSGTEVAVARVANLLVCEWGQRSFMGKEYSRHFLHPLKQMLVQKEKEREQKQGPPLSASVKHNRRHHSNSHSVQLPPRSGSISSIKGRSSGIRRASCSVVDSLTAMWHNQNNPVASHRATSPVASPRSSISSGSGSISASVTWADQRQSSLGRSGSGSTTGSGAGGSRSGHTEGIALAIKNARRKSGESEQKGVIEEGYVLS